MARVVVNRDDEIADYDPSDFYSMACAVGECRYCSFGGCVCNCHETRERRARRKREEWDG